MKILKRFFSKIMMLIVAITLIMPTTPVKADTTTSGTIGAHGTWLTTYNIEKINNQITQDIDNIYQPFVSTQLAPEYVPIEAKIGIVFMNAMSWLANILDMSLVRFVIVFIIVMYIFWMMLETYNMMTNVTDIKKFIEDIVKKGVLVVIWMMVLNIGPTKIFIYLMTPILQLGTALADFILNSITNIAGVSLPDTCNAIKAYVETNAQSQLILEPEMAANIMCLPTRISGLFYTGIGIGLKWMIYGIGHSMLTFMAGVLFVGIFFINIWKFALMTLGVIADLFLALMLLPFTAIAETVNQTSYKGMAGTAYNSFAKLIKVDSLSAQISRFINASVYFVSLSIVIALCATLMAGTLTNDTALQIPTLDNSNFMITIMTGFLVLYMANKADSLAKQLGGSINDSLGQQFGKDLLRLTQDTWNTGKGWYKAWRSAK